MPSSVRSRPAPVESGAPRAEAAPSLHLLLDWLAGHWGDVGCTWDPNGGGCREAAGSWPVTGSDSLEAGCTWDPSGVGCGRAANLDNGCTMDPSGGGCRGGR